MITSATALGHLLVRKLETYGPLADEDKAALLAITAEVRRVEAGKDLVQEGASPESVLVIVEGFACRYQLFPCGSRHITAYLLPGDLSDVDVSLLPSMDHSIGTLSACLVAQLAPAVVQDLLQRPGLAPALRLATLAEIANLREWLVNLGLRRSANRVAHLLCGLLARLRAVGLADHDSFDFPLTQTDLADTMGMSTVHMNRSLQELRSAKLIELRRSRLTICDLPKLKAFAHSENKYLHLDQRAVA